MFRWLPVTVLAVLVVSCQAPSLAVYSPGLTKPRFTRVNLRTGDGIFLRSSNILTERDLVPAGSPVRISHNGFTRDHVNFSIHKVEYTMRPVSGTFDTSEQGVEDFLEKYFVDTQQEIDLEKLGSPELVEDVRRGRVLRGMTKEQVYVAFGPPQWIDENNLATLQLQKDRIFQSDRWVYTESLMASFFARKSVYVFREGKLQEMSR